MNCKLTGICERSFLVKRRMNIQVRSQLTEENGSSVFTEEVTID